MNKKIKMLWMVLFLVLLAIPVKAAITIDIDIKSVFKLGETINFNYTIISSTSENVTYAPLVVCPTAPLSVLVPKTSYLQKDVPFKSNYTFFLISESIEPQECTASIRIIRPFEFTREENFTIDVPPSFKFRILTCQDQDCDEIKNVFVLGEIIYLDYDSEVVEPEAEGVLTLPDDTIKQITLPGLIEAEQIGTYDLEITASKENYKTFTKKTQFGVIEEEARIDYLEIKEEVERVNVLLIVLIVVFTVIVLAFGGFEFYRLKYSKIRDITEIQTYIQVNLQQGYSFVQIKRSLLRTGWKEKLINKAFKKALKRKE